MPAYDDYASPIRHMIDNAIDTGVNVANEMANDMSPEEKMKHFTPDFVFDQCCVALALLLSASENGDPEFAPLGMREAMRRRLAQQIRYVST
jgi:hypothetical protein